MRARLTGACYSLSAMTMSCRPQKVHKPIWEGSGRQRLIPIIRAYLQQLQQYGSR